MICVPTISAAARCPGLGSHFGALHAADVSAVSAWAAIAPQFGWIDPWVKHTDVENVSYNR